MFAPKSVPAAFAVAVFSVAMATPVFADDTEPTGVPEPSIAAGWNDPVRAAFARAGINYGINYTGEYFNVTSGGHYHRFDL